MIKYSDIELAFMYVSSTSYGMNTAVLNKDTGELYYESAMGDADEINENELDLNLDIFIEIPHKNDLDLGQELVFEFVEVNMNDEYDLVREIFRKREAYSRFKDLLDSRGLLQDWYDFENEREEQALRYWCELNGLEISS